MATYAASTDALLSYGARTDPTVLPAGHDSGAVLITCGAKSGTTAYCDKIVVRIPVGPGSGDLSGTQPAAGIKPDLDDIGVAPDSWEHSAGPVSGGKREFVFKNDRDDRTKFDGRNLVLILKEIPVNAVTGNVTIEIDEYSAPTNATTTKRSTTVVVRKAPDGFEFHSFRPLQMMVPNGDPAELTWVGSPTAAEYTMYWGLDNDAVMDPKKNPPWTSPEKLTNTTGYMLQAKVESPNGPMFFTQTCVVSVERPDLEIGNLDVLGKAVMHDGLEARGQVKMLKRTVLGLSAGGELHTTAPTDGFLVIRLLTDGRIDFYTDYNNYFQIVSRGTYTFPFAAGELVRIKYVTSGNASFWWCGMGGVPLTFSAASS